MRRRLDVELVRRGMVPSRTQAATAIAAGRVLVGGAPAASSARQVEPGESVTLLGEDPRFVSRGGDKLDAALEAFAVPVQGRGALDVGASTGGFTDCLLQRGAASVVALDVGHGQLAWSLRADPRVQVRDRTNVRHVRPEDIGGPFDLVVADVSFISLRTIAPVLSDLLAPAGDLVALVKPQFEVGRAGLGKGGIVRDHEGRLRAVRSVLDAMRDAVLMGDAVMPSPRRGADGNVEFLVHATHGGAPLDDATVQDVVVGRSR